MGELKTSAVRVAGLRAKRNGLGFRVVHVFGRFLNPEHSSVTDPLSPAFFYSTLDPKPNILNVGRAASLICAEGRGW